jgi:glycosyltransferase involved in cell wall biosynthesis
MAGDRNALAGRLPAYRVLSTDPPVVYMLHWLNPVVVFGLLRPLSAALAGRRAHFLVRECWTVADPARARAVAEWEGNYLDEFPLHRFVHLAKSPDELAALASVGLTSVYCHTNCLIDTTYYHPEATAEAVFDAVYDARLMPYKRHELAVDVPSLALTYADDWQGPSTLEPVRALLPRAYFANHDPGPGYRQLSPAEVNRLYCASRVGLCLSAEEGGMYASTQYLLSGLPVVTTKASGGRDAFFDPGFVTTVDDDPASVAEAVRELGQRDLDRGEIRRSTLALVDEHRSRFVQVVCDIFADEAVPRDFRSEWPKLFSHKLFRMQEASIAVELFMRTASAATPRSQDDAPGY